MSVNDFMSSEKTLRELEKKQADLTKAKAKARKKHAEALKTMLWKEALSLTNKRTFTTEDVVRLTKWFKVFEVRHHFFSTALQCDPEATREWETINMKENPHSQPPEKQSHSEEQREVQNNQSPW